MPKLCTPVFQYISGQHMFTRLEHESNILRRHVHDSRHHTCCAGNALMSTRDPAEFAAYLPRKIAALHTDYGWAHDFIDAAKIIESSIGLKSPSRSKVAPSAPSAPTEPRKRRAPVLPPQKGFFF